MVKTLARFLSQKNSLPNPTGSNLFSTKLDLTTGKTVGTPVRISTGEGFIAQASVTADAKRIALTVNVDPTAAQVTGDAERLQQVIWNLANNAIKFTPKGGAVDVDLSRVGTDVQITITDNGEGIGADFLPHVFERFRQAEGSTTRRHGGLGLGLALVRHLVEAHGGTIWAESVVGAGSRPGTPVQAATPAAPDKRLAHVAANPGGGARLIIRGARRRGIWARRRAGTTRRAATKPQATATSRLVMGRATT
jgi:signal transduction histidine kinase